MPKYFCKQVFALKIKEVQFDCDKAIEENRDSTGTAILVPENPDYAPFEADAHYVHTQHPRAGGYYVILGGFTFYYTSETFESMFSEQKYSISPKDEKIIADARTNGTKIFVLTAKDKLSVDALEAYKESCENNECDLAHVEGVQSRIIEFLEWQEDHKAQTKLPD